MATRTTSGGSWKCGSPGINPSASPPETKSSGAGKRHTAAMTSIAASAASRISSWSSPWAVKCTASRLEGCCETHAVPHQPSTCANLAPRGEPGYEPRVLRSVCEVFVLRELAQGLGLDLAHALARQSELLADRLQRGGAVADEPEAELDHVALAVRQVRDRLADCQVAERGRSLLLGRRAGAGDQVAAGRVAVVADGHVGRCDRACGGHHFLNVVERQLRVRRDLLGRGVTLERRDELAAGAGDLLLALDDVHRDADRARLVGDTALHRLADPPGRVRRELEALPPVELLRRADQAENALLDEVAERDALRLVALRDRDDQPQVAVDHPLLGGHVALLDALRQLDLLRG